MLQPDPTLYPGIKLSLKFIQHSNFFFFLLILLLKFLLPITELPESVDNYHELVPLEPLPIGGPLQIGHSSTYKATHIKTGIRYCLRRIHGK